MANLLIVIVNSSGINGNLLMVLIYHLYYSTTPAILSQRHFLKGHKSSENQQEAEGITPLKPVEPREPTGLGTRRATASQDCGLVIHCSSLCDEIHFSCPFRNLLKIAIPDTESNWLSLDHVPSSKEREEWISFRFLRGRHAISMLS